MRQISYVCGSPVNANWISSRFAIRMLAQRDLPIKSTLEQGSTTTLTGSRSIMRQGGGISPGSFSCTRRLRALLRDATPLRLLSWLSLRLEPAVDELFEATMLHLSTVEEVKDIDLLALGTKHLDMETPFESAEALRDHLIELISVRNLRHRPEALFVCTVPTILAEAHVT